MGETVILAYSGGLDTSILIKWLQQEYKMNVITATIDVGQKENLNEIEKKATNLGVLKHYSIDGKKEFAENYIFQAIKANALYEDKYPISTALARPLIVAKMVEIAKKEGATAIAHGCSGKGNDQVRFDVTTKSLAPDLKIIAPIRERNMARKKEIEYAKANGIPVPVSVDKPYSVDQNLWGRSIECGILEQPDREPPKEIYEWTTAPEKAPDKPEYIAVTFENGVPTAINEHNLDPVTLIENLNETAGKHGIGRIDHIEDRLIGIKSREIYECPAATVLIEAHKDLEKMILTRHELQFKQQIETQWTFLAYAGLWTDPLREALDAFVDKTQERLNGTVKTKLYKGTCQIIGRSSPMSLYSSSLAAYDGKTNLDQKWSHGFIELWGLQTTTFNNLKAEAKTTRRR